MEDTTNSEHFQVISRLNEILYRSEWTAAAKTIQKHKETFLTCRPEVFTVKKDDIIADLLYAAVNCDCPAVAEVVILHGCDVNHGVTTAYRPHPRTPLYHAAKQGHVEIVQMLLDAGCDRNALNNTGCTALYEAVFEGHVEVAKILLENGCDPNIPDCYGKSPMHILPFSNAAAEDTVQCIQLLMKYGADLSLLCASNQTAADLAVQYKFGLTVLYLMEHAQELGVQRIPLCPYILGDRVLPELLLTGGGMLMVDELGHTECGGHLLGTLLVQLHPCHEISQHTMDEFIRVCETKPNEQYDFHAPARKFCNLMLLSGVANIPIKSPLTLEENCRITIRRYLAEESWYSAPHLPLPSGIQDYLQLKDIINIDSHVFIH